MSFPLYPPEGTEFEPDALVQFRSVCVHENTIAAAGMPDLHPGKAGPVGMALLGRLPVPALVGGDLGCGFSLFRLDIKARRMADAEWLAEHMNGLDAPWEGKLPDIGFTTVHDMSMGSIGSGNHFIEIQTVHSSEISDIGEGTALLLVHTGSRGFGESVYRNVTSVCRDNPLEDYEHWFAEHERCLKWASANRALVALRTAEALGADHELILDVPHNFVEKTDAGFLHRKGSSPANRGPSVLPGSRGTPTYLLKPLDTDIALDSLPHGAGRRLSRSAAREGTQSTAMLRQSPPLSSGRKGSIVVCGNEDLMLEERPRAYKDVGSVLKGTENAGLAVKIAEFHPVVTFKCSEGDNRKKDRSRTPEAKKRDVERRSRR